MEAEQFIFIVAASLFLTAERVQSYFIFKQNVDEILAAHCIQELFRPLKANRLSFFAEQIVEENALFAEKKQVVVKGAHSLPPEIQGKTQAVLVGAIKVKNAHFLVAAVHREDQIGAVHDDVIGLHQAATAVVHPSECAFQRACRGEFVNFDVLLIEEKQFARWPNDKADRPKRFDIGSEQLGFQRQEVDVFDHAQVGVELDQSAVHLIENKHALPVGDGNFARKIKAFFADSFPADHLHGIKSRHFEVLINAVFFGLKQVNIAFLIGFEVGNVSRNARNDLARRLENRVSFGLRLEQAGELYGHPAKNGTTEGRFHPPAKR